MKAKEAKELPVNAIRESLELDLSSKSGLRWKFRPRHHFGAESAWKAWNARFSGKPAGRSRLCNGKQYFALCLNYQEYYAHRIIFAISNGFNSLNSNVDHIDGNGQNNAPSNLRLATVAENQRNRGAQRNNTSGKKGVSFEKRTGKWRASMQVSGKKIHIGYYDNLDEASAAYEAAAREHFGEFYRPS